MSRPKCGNCKQRFPKEEMVQRGIQYFCENCRGKPQKVSRKTKPKVSVDLDQQVYDLVTRVDGGRCRWCGTLSGVDRHHVHYRSDPVNGLTVRHNLVLLCEKHHQKAHADKKKYQHVLLAIIWMRDVEGREFTVPEMLRYLGED